MKHSRFKSGPIKKRYFELVNFYRESPPKSGERHHITPRSLGGSDRPKNIVLVPTRVHYELHQMLVEMCVTEGHKNSMIWALWRMSNPQTWNHKDRTITPEQYEKAKRLHADNIRGDKNPMRRPEVVAKFIGRKRPEQAEVIRLVNEGKKLDKKLRKYTCSYCNKIEKVLEFAHHKRKENWCCCRSCYYRFKNPDKAILLEKQDKEQRRLQKKTEGMSDRQRLKYVEQRRRRKLSNSCKGRVPWNKGKPNTLSAENARKGAAKVSVLMLGSKLKTRKDGTRYWVRPK
jgi:hypothetical protein